MLPPDPRLPSGTPLPNATPLPDMTGKGGDDFIPNEEANQDQGFFDDDSSIEESDEGFFDDADMDDIF